MQKISSILITYNEESNIKDCLESIIWTDEIIIVDSKSTDKTVEIAAKYTDKIIITDDLPYYKKKNLGIENATHDWILSIDADERVNETLKNEIIEVLNSTESKFNAYYINRKSFFIKKFIKHCGWYPDYVLRLFRKSYNAHFSEGLVHEKIITEGQIGKFNSELIHYTDRNFEHYIEKLNRYTSYSAEELAKKGKRIGIIDIIFRPAFTFIKMYFLKLGFMDGFTGFELCILSSFHVFVKYSKLHFLINKRI